MDKIQVCDCGKIPRKKTLLNSQAHVGITTEFLDSGVFKNNKALYLENNYCPQCGKMYVEKPEKEAQALLKGSEG
jgi:hypothetical protein